VVGEQGVAAITMDAVVAAHSATLSFYAAFGNRGGLLRTVFEHHSSSLDAVGVAVPPGRAP
jgi:hypothetical protein